MAYKPRLTKPEAGNKYYIRKASGGYSNAIKGNPTDKYCDVLSNCVGYAYGRFNEIGDYGYMKYLQPTNAELFIKYCGELPVGDTPKLGACMVWQKGTQAGYDGAGHVAIVEQIISKDEVITSESAWGGYDFMTARRKRGADGNWGQAYKFLGFIYNPAVSDDEPIPEPKPTGEVVEGSIVTFVGEVHYPSSSASDGFECLSGEATVTKIAEGAKHPYHLIRVSGGASNVYGWVDTCDIAELNKLEPEEPTPAPTPTPAPIEPEGLVIKVDDEVNFIGNKHYVKANGDDGYPCTSGKAIVTKIVEDADHPYHLVRVNGGSSSVYGWVNAEDIEGNKRPEPKPNSVKPESGIKVGDKVYVKKNAPDWNGNYFANFVYNRVHVIKSLEGNRAVITYNGIVVGAVHVDNLIKV